jgi:hypothetical protein
VFTATTIAKLGTTAPTCSWMEQNKKLKVVLSAGTTIQNNDTIQFDKMNMYTTEGECTFDR